MDRNNILFKLVKEAAQENNIPVYADSMSMIKNAQFVKKGVEYSNFKIKELIQKHFKSRVNLTLTEITTILDRVLAEVIQIELDEFPDLSGIDMEKARKCL